MALCKVQITNLRNIDSASLTVGPGINLIYGGNGSGKTSLLEAIHLLGLARSFRVVRHGPLIKNGEQELTVFGEMVQEGGTPARLGVAKTRSGETTLRFNEAPAQSAADLAIQLPVLSLTANTFDLLTGSPKVRRSLIDWLAFHVEPEFIGNWRGLQSTLKQRNSLLRRGKIKPLELAPWNQQLIVFAEKIDNVRKRVTGLLKGAFSSFEPLFPEFGDVEIGYSQGWNKELGYGQALEAHKEHDIARGHTQVGPHRADIKIQIEGSLASETLSRGQQKLLISALVLAVGNVYYEQTRRRCTYLVDDLPSEFDQHNRKLVAEWLNKLNSQVFITGIEIGPLLAMWPEGEEVTKFHVERGQVQMLPCCRKA